MSSILDLIIRLEKATEGSQEMDVEILKATGALPAGLVADGIWSANGMHFLACCRPGEQDQYPRYQRDIMIKSYTTSLDAALTLYKSKPLAIPTNPITACLEALRQARSSQAAQVRADE